MSGRIKEITSSLLTDTIRQEDIDYFDLKESGQIKVSFPGPYWLDIDVPQGGKTIQITVTGSGGECQLLLPRRLWDKHFKERLDILTRYNAFWEAHTDSLLDETEELRAAQHKACGELLREAAQNNTPPITLSDTTARNLFGLLAEMMRPQLQQDLQR